LIRDKQPTPQRQEKECVIVIDWIYSKDDVVEL